MSELLTQASLICASVKHPKESMSKLDHCYCPDLLYPSLSVSQAMWELIRDQRASSHLYLLSPLRFLILPVSKCCLPNVSNSYHPTATTLVQACITFMSAVASQLISQTSNSIFSELSIKSDVIRSNYVTIQSPWVALISPVVNVRYSRCL